PVGNSPTIAPISEIVIATLRLVNRNGRDAGQRSFQKICAGVADQVRIRSRWIGSGEVRPFTMPVVTGKKHKEAEMIDFGSSPRSPSEPSTTMTIGAMARIGTICEQMIHGNRLFSSVRACTISTARRIPNALPSAKPTTVADSVTQLW